MSTIKIEEIVEIEEKIITKSLTSYPNSDEIYRTGILVKTTKGNIYLGMDSDQGDEESYSVRVLTEEPLASFYDATILSTLYEVDEYLRDGENYYRSGDVSSVSITIKTSVGNIALIASVEHYDKQLVWSKVFDWEKEFYI